jgi:hypothetical protein
MPTHRVGPTAATAYSHRRAVSAGRGIRHDQINARETLRAPTRFLPLDASWRQPR